MTEAGFDVTGFDQWPAHVEAIRANGLTVRSPGGEGRVTQLDIHHLCEIAEVKQPFDLVYIVTKAYDARWHCEPIKPVLKPAGLAVGLQNGMTLDDMADVLGPERTFASAIEIAGNCFAPGVVERQTPPEGCWFALGPYDERPLLRPPHPLRRRRRRIPRRDQTHPARAPRPVPLGPGGALSRRRCPSPTSTGPAVEAAGIDRPE